MSGDRPNIDADNLLSAGRRYGDARVAREKLIGSADAPAEAEAIAAVLDAEWELCRAARAYATRMRLRKPTIPPVPASGRRP